MILIILSLFGAIIYMVVTCFKTSFNVKIHIPVLIANLVIGCCLSYCKGTIVGTIMFFILSGIDHYIIFYSLLKEVNKISLLLFWTDLWYILFGIYISVENAIVEDDDAEFDLGDFIDRD